MDATISTVIRSVKEVLEIRASALADLDGCFASADPEWVSDRVKDVDYANRTIERLARLEGMEPAALVAACD